MLQKKNQFQALQLSEDLGGYWPVSLFHTNLKLAKFKFEETDQDKVDNSNVPFVLICATKTDFVWLVMSRNEQVPY